MTTAAYHRAWRKANPERSKAATKRWRANNPDKARSIWLKQYGLTAGEYDAMLVGQRGVCAICKIVPGGRRLAVDHCHATGKVRGLLCFGCNVSLGYLKDNPDLFAAAERYLRGL